MKKNRYWRNGVFAVLALGITITVGSRLLSQSLDDVGDSTHFWEQSFDFGMAVSGIGVAGWLWLTAPRVSVDVARVCKASRTTALVTLTLFALFVVKLYRFTGPHFYGWDHPEAWIFFALALLLAAYLLLRACLALTDALKK